MVVAGLGSIPLFPKKDKVMYIIDKNKEFYDHFSYIYGIDKCITFDSRGSINLNDENIFNMINYESKSSIKESFILLEVGYIQYLIKVFNIKLKSIPLDLVYDKFISFSLEVVWIFHNYKHYYKSPISIRGVYVDYIWRYKKDRKYILNDNFNEVIVGVYGEAIDLPILANTQLTSLINGEKIWKELQNYISSLDNDLDIEIPMTDVEKAVNHGFDKKTSFRHPIK